MPPPLYFPVAKGSWYPSSRISGSPRNHFFTCSVQEESSHGGTAMNGNNGTTTPGGKEEEREVCEEGPGICAHLLTVAALFMVVTTLPLSLFFVVKVVQVRGFLFFSRLSRHCIATVQEYERAVIFRLGRLLAGGARGPGVFFIIPCVDVYEKIDMRSQTYEIPPQEVGFTAQLLRASLIKFICRS